MPILVSKVFNVKPPYLANVVNMEDEAELENSNQLAEELPLTPEQQNLIYHRDSSPQMDLEAVGDIFDDLLAGNTTVHDHCS